MEEKLKDVLKSRSQLRKEIIRNLLMCSKSLKRLISSRKDFSYILVIKAT